MNGCFFYFLERSSRSIRSSCGEPLNVVVQFCFTMSNISYQSRLDYFWNACPIWTKGLAIAPPVVGCLPMSPY